MPPGWFEVEDEQRVVEGADYVEKVLGLCEAIITGSEVICTPQQSRVESLSSISLIHRVNHGRALSRLMNNPDDAVSLGEL